MLTQNKALAKSIKEINSVDELIPLESKNNELRCEECNSLVDDDDNYCFLCGAKLYKQTLN